MNFSKGLMLNLLFLLFFYGNAPAFGPAGDVASGPAPELGRDLAVELKLPVFDADVAAVPVASLGLEPVTLGELTPAMIQSSRFLFWETKTSGAELSEQFRAALTARIAEKSGPSATMTTFTRGDIDDQQRLQLDAPLFAEMFAEVPVALVNGTPITIAEFARDLEAVHMDAAGDHAHSGAQENVQQLIERLITVRLVEQEARNIGFDQSGSFKRQRDNFAVKTLLFGLINTHVAGVSLDQEAVEELYQQVSLEGKLESYRFESENPARELLAAAADGGDFDAMIAAAAERGIAIPGRDTDYMKFNELLPNIAKAAVTMEIGAVSELFRQADGFVLFKLVDRRFVDDPNARQFAVKNVWENQRSSAGTEYINEIIDSYTTINEDVQTALDFSAIKQASPEMTLKEALRPLLQDQRVLATVAGAEPGQLMVAEVAKKIEETFFHGTDVALKPAEVNKVKQDILQDTLFRMAGTIEATKMGLDQREDYQLEIAEFERRTLFDIFMQRVLIPEVRYTEEQVRNYYDEHQADYMTPAMLKFESLPFYKAQDAQAAAEKLRKGSDFKWVSANSAGMVDVQDADLLKFDRNILSLTALPQSLQSQARDAKRGDTLVYHDPESFYYVLYFENVFPPEVKPYDQVREEILKIVYQQEVEATLAQWVGKLKEAYETKIFLVQKGS